MFFEGVYGLLIFLVFGGIFLVNVGCFFDVIGVNCDWLRLLVWSLLLDLMCGICYWEFSIDVVVFVVIIMRRYRVGFIVIDRCLYGELKLL